MAKKTYTLVEMILVIAILTIMMVIIVPQVGRYLEKSRNAKRVMDMQTIYAALEAFWMDNRRYPGAAEGIADPGECIGARNRLRGTNVTTQCAAADTVDGDLDIALRRYIRGQVPADPLYTVSGDRFFYVYDPSHAINWCDADAANDDTLPVLGFIRAEGNFPVDRDTCTNSDLSLNEAVYNRALVSER